MFARDRQMRDINPPKRYTIEEFVAFALAEKMECYEWINKKLCCKAQLH